jgi:hypothetical protein
MKPATTVASVTPVHDGWIALPRILGREDTQRQAHCRAQPERRHHVSTVALPDQSPQLDHGRLRSKSPGCDSQVLPVWGSTREEQLRRIRIVEEAGARRLRPPSHVPRRLTSSRYPDRAADSLEVLQQKAGASVDAALGAPRAAQPQREPGRHRRSIGMACHIGGRRIGPPSGRRVSNRTAAIPGATVGPRSWSGTVTHGEVSARRRTPVDVSRPPAADFQAGHARRDDGLEMYVRVVRDPHT